MMEVELYVACSGRSIISLALQDRVRLRQAWKPSAGLLPLLLLLSNGWFTCSRASNITAYLMQQGKQTIRRAYKFTT
jgi:hypothetical protein